MHDDREGWRGAGRGRERERERKRQTWLRVGATDRPENKELICASGRFCSLLGCWQNRIKLSRTIATGKVVGTARVCQYIVSILFSLFLFPSPFFHNIFFSFYAICVSGWLDCCSRDAVPHDCRELHGRRSEGKHTRKKQNKRWSLHISTIKIDKPEK